MNIEYISSLFEFAGGIGMFLYGMNTMADGMQRSAGGKMKKLLGYLTSNRLLAIIVGAVITAIIQSSGATTVMVVGFVNAGLMTLVQAVGVIMGANIVRHLHTGDEESPSQQDHHRTSGYIRTRTYRRRLPSCCSVPVSYTHLDVYKRQEIY